ncbi:COG5653 Protein involved in cellulose biosynthesis (CelD) [Rhabdaerophilaceae bacterium]
MSISSSNSGNRLQVLSISTGAEALARLADPRIVAGPFQRATWISPFARKIGEAMRRLHLLEIGEGNQSLLLPLEVRRRAMFNQADIFGGKHASFNLPARIGDLGATRDELRAVLVDAGQRLGIDAFTLTDLPEMHAGLANPLVTLGGQESPSAGWSTEIEQDVNAMLDARSDRDYRRKLRQKINRLSTIGPIRSGWVTDPSEQRLVWTMMFSWKALRFRESGIIDPFSDHETQEFLQEASRGPNASVRLFALYCGDRLAASMAGATNDHTFSSMLNGHEPAPEIARNSPGEQLIASLIPVLSSEGYASFDLGVGEASYKNRYCPTRIPLVDVAIPVSLAGIAAARLFLLRRKLKRQVKQDERLTKLVTIGRRLLRR